MTSESSDFEYRDYLKAIEVVTPVIPAAARAALEFAVRRLVNDAEALDRENGDDTASLTTDRLNPQEWVLVNYTEWFSSCGPNGKLSLSLVRPLSLIAYIVGIIVLYWASEVRTINDVLVSTVAIGTVVAFALSEYPDIIRKSGGESIPKPAVIKRILGLYYEVYSRDTRKTFLPPFLAVLTAFRRLQKFAYLHLTLKSQRPLSYKANTAAEIAALLLMGSSLFLIMYLHPRDSLRVFLYIILLLSTGSAVRHRMVAVASRHALN